LFFRVVFFFVSETATTYIYTLSLHDALPMALLAETATGFVTAMNVPDSAIVLIKSLKVDYKRPSKGAMTAVATLTAEQQQLMQSSDRGETLVRVIITDESGEEPIQCEMLWAWLAKSQLKKA